ncbi:AAA domain-containing protein [Marinobacter sp. 2_MG-2023]|uniref:AAA domain-containing protein n=1 Tax=Marinobacter sp. 2_MG-2023 TaxID=3062679 RepID=UPI0026E15816|nr:AAA domain-containing protein [Marinobacter sp. 2_MG-2023]MDO6442928.1 AAA domain-containing protein [Marinobacter sp. 2_MG-2023]
MVTIHVDGQDKTKQINDWKIRDSRKGLELTCFFPSGKSYTRPLSECQVTPTEVLEDALLVKKNGSVFGQVDRAVVYGNKQAVVQYSENAKTYVMNMDNIRLVKKTKLKDGEVFRYFVSVAEARLEKAKASSKEDAAIAENVLRQLKALPSNPEIVLNSYCTGFSQPRESQENLIFPFGINESQLEAVAGVFSSQVSIIKGPPGTGKTQTILNIVANILLRNETVAILSNNNTAVENVYEKLGKEGLDFLVAKLGNRENRKNFFENTPSLPTGESPPAPLLNDIEADVENLKQFLHARNEVAKLQAEVDELNIERKHLLHWRQENLETDPNSPKTDPLEKYRLSKQKITDLMAYLTMLDDKPVSMRNRIELWLNFRILRIKPFSTTDKRDATIHALQLRYYDKSLQEKEAELASCQETLKNGDFDALLASVTTSSMAYLKDQLQQRKRPEEAFTSEGYRDRIDAFLKSYPIIGSSTHSIINSLKSGTVLDYAIIDEASQQDIIPGILALGCARNLVIVGDGKQLPPIFTKTGKSAPDRAYDCEKYSLLDSCLRVFGDTIPVTLLKEHYRCHPRIIQFCNQQFYDNELIPMTQDAGEDVLQLIVTAKGNHTRLYKNQRELDSLLHVLEGGESSQWDEASKRGFIAPYNAQVALSRSHLPASFIKDTTHKFQGRECDEIVFSTVLDKKASNQKNLGFVDDPHLINVAVSRAKEKFTLVTGDDVFSASSGPVAALIRYIEYYANEAAQVHRSPVVSAFDLLYAEYDQSLEKLQSALRAGDSQFRSEQIVAQILRERLSLPANQGITFHTQIALNQLVSLNNEALTARERGFMKGRSSCDFVLYFKVGKKPLAVIEVDGGDHEKPQQKQWDALKNSILQKGGLPLLRLKTVESHIEEKVGKFLVTVTGTTRVNTMEVSE